jgi:hypothetical protein
MTMLSGFVNNMRSMITGVYTIPAEDRRSASAIARRLTK